MHYEEEIIDGILHWRGSPNDTWRPVSAEAMTQKIARLEVDLERAKDALLAVHKRDAAKDQYVRELERKAELSERLVAALNDLNVIYKKDNAE